jgi:hypothetical protein
VKEFCAQLLVQGSGRVPEPATPDLRPDAGQGFALGLRQWPQDTHPHAPPDQYER